MADIASGAPASATPTTASTPSAQAAPGEGQAPKTQDGQGAKPNTSPEVEYFEYDHGGTRRKIPKAEIPKALAELERISTTEKSGPSADQLLAEFKQNPAAFMKKAGIDPDEFSQKQVHDYVQQLRDEAELQKLSPSERRVRELEQELNRRDNETKKTQEEAQTRAQQQEVIKIQSEYIQTIESALEQTQLPHEAKTLEGTSVVKRMANMLHALKKKGMTDVPPHVLARAVEKQVQAEHQALWKAMTPKQLRTHLGDDLIKAVLADYITERKGNSFPAKDTEAPTHEKKKDEAPETFGLAEWRNRRWS